MKPARPFGLILVAAVVATAPLQAHAIGPFNLKTVTKMIPGAELLSTTDVDELLRTANEAEALMNSSADHILRALGGESTVAAYDEKIELASFLDDPSESKAMLLAARSERDSQLSDMLEIAHSTGALNSLQGEQLKSFVAASEAFIRGMQKNQEIFTQAQELVQTAPTNPLLLAKVITLKDIVVSITNQTKTSLKIGQALLQFAQVADLNLLPGAPDKKAGIKSILFPFL